MTTESRGRCLLVSISTWCIATLVTLNSSRAIPHCDFPRLMPRFLMSSPRPCGSIGLPPWDRGAASASSGPRPRRSPRLDPSAVAAPRSRGRRRAQRYRRRPPIGDGAARGESRTEGGPRGSIEHGGRAALVPWPRCFHVTAAIQGLGRSVARWLGASALRVTGTFACRGRSFPVWFEPLVIGGPGKSGREGNLVYGDRGASAPGEVGLSTAIPLDPSVPGRRLRGIDSGQLHSMPRSCR
jgi:hypothetical protein